MTSGSSSSTSAGRRILTRFAAPFSQKGRSICDFHVKADDPHKQYSPGESVKGHVVVKVVKPVRVTHLSVCLHGFVQVYRNPGAPNEQMRGNSSRIGRTTGKKSGEYFGNGFASLFEDESVLCGEGRLQEGLYRFDFEVQFPDDIDLPSSIDFERGTISYMITATLTRPTTIAPVISHDLKMYLVERVDIAPLLPPKPRTITLEPVPKKAVRKRLADTSTSTSTPSLSTPKDDLPPTPSVSELSLDSRVSGNTAISATVQLTKGACLRGDSFPVKITVNHSKPVKSINGIIITLYRQARVDMHPALLLGPTSDGQKRKYEDYYPRSITGLGGLSLSGSGSSHMFRKDLSQVLVPLIVDPITLTAEIGAKIGVPHGAFPTITSVPGAMISFKYYIEVVLDIQGKLTHDRYLSQHGNGPAFAPSSAAHHDSDRFTTPEDSPFLMLNGPGILDTAPIRRDKSVATCTFEVVVGTLDSERNKGKGKGKAKARTPSPADREHVIDTSQYSQYPPPNTSNNPFHHHQPDIHAYNYDPDNLQGDWSGTNHDYAFEDYQWDGQDYPYDEQYEPPYFEPPPMEDEDALPEKERLRRAEARLMPSQPPPLAESSNQAEQASAPVLDFDPQDHHYTSITVAGASQVSGLPRTENQQGYIPPAEVSTSPGFIHNNSDSRADPTDDKQELQRRQLQVAASRPPIAGSSYWEDHADPGPSAPPVFDDDLDDYAQDNIHSTGDVSEHLPTYQR